MEDIYLHTSVT